MNRNPAESERNRILLRLIEIRAFHGIWLRCGLVFVRRHEHLWEEPEYLSWAEARKIAMLERKPGKSGYALSKLREGSHTK